MKKCPFCAEEIQDEAIKCKHCGEWVGSKSTGRSFTSDADIEKMLKKKGLFDAKRNKNGPYSGNFVNNYDGTVTHRKMKLMWEEGGSPTRLSATGAQSYIDGLNSRKLSGHSDWRLPTIADLASLLTPKWEEGVLFRNPVFGPLKVVCWSSEATPSKDNKWYINFHTGTISQSHGDKCHVKAVRTTEHDFQKPRGEWSSKKANPERVQIEELSDPIVSNERITVTEERSVCPDGTCTGILDATGFCSECGRTAAETRMGVQSRVASVGLTLLPGMVPRRLVRCLNLSAISYAASSALWFWAMSVVGQLHRPTQSLVVVLSPLLIFLFRVIFLIYVAKVAVYLHKSPCEDSGTLFNARIVGRSLII